MRAGKDLFRSNSAKERDNHTRAASKIQKHFRGQTTRRKFLEMARLFKRPTLAAARKHATESLMHDARSGKLLPFWCTLHEFDQFGEGVSAYMHLIDKFQGLFWVLFLLNLSNIATSVSGGALGADANIFNIGSIGNAEVLGPAYGVMELVCSLLIVRFMYNTRHFLDTEAQRIDDEQLTAADLAVRVDA